MKTERIQRAYDDAQTIKYADAMDNFRGTGATVWNLQICLFEHIKSDLGRLRKEIQMVGMRKRLKR